MKTITPVLAERLKSLPLTEVERLEATRWVETGAALADALLAVAQWFHRHPNLKHAH
jgi:hypothetical protein